MTNTTCYGVKDGNSADFAICASISDALLVAGRMATARLEPMTVYVMGSDAGELVYPRVTRAQIDALRDDAVAAGDDDQRHLCDLALSTGRDVPSEERVDAIEACADAIIAADAAISVTTEDLVEALRRADRTELVHYAGAMHRDRVAWHVVREWRADRSACEARLRERALAKVFPFARP